MENIGKDNFDGNEDVNERRDVPAISTVVPGGQMPKGGRTM